MTSLVEGIGCGNIPCHPKELVESLEVWMWGIIAAENVLEFIVGRQKRKCCDVTRVYF